MGVRVNSDTKTRLRLWLMPFLSARDKTIFFPPTIANSVKDGT